MSIIEKLLLVASFIAKQVNKLHVPCFFIQLYIYFYAYWTYCFILARFSFRYLVEWALNILGCLLSSAELLHKVRDFMQEGK